MQPQAKRGKTLHAQDCIATVRAPSKARVVNANAPQLPEGTVGRGASAGVGVAPCKVLEDPVDHPSPVSGGVKAIGGRIGPRVAGDLGPLPAKRVRTGMGDEATLIGLEHRSERPGLPVSPTAQEHLAIVGLNGKSLLTKRISHRVHPPPQVLERTVLASVPQANGPREGPGNGAGGFAGMVANATGTARAGSRTRAGRRGYGGHEV